MEVLYKKYAQEDVRAFVGIDPSVSFKNVLNALLASPRYRSTELTSTATLYSQYLDAALMTTGRRWERLTNGSALRARAAKEDPDNADEAKGISVRTFLPVLAERLFADARIVEYINDILIYWIGPMLLPRVDVLDWGGCTKKELIDRRIVTTEAVQTLELLAPQIQMRMDSFPVPNLEQAFYLPLPDEALVSEFATLLMTLDRWRLDDSWIPTVDKEKGSDRSYGPTYRIRAMVERFEEYTVPYITSALRLFYAFGHRQREVCREAYRFTEPRFRVIAEAELADEREFLSLPVHPLVSYFENLWRSGIVRSAAGNHPAIWVRQNVFEALKSGTVTAGDNHVGGEEGDAAIRYTCEGTSPLRSAYISRLSDGSTIPGPSGDCDGGNWGNWAYYRDANKHIAARWKGLEKNERCSWSFTPSDYLSALSTYSRLTDHRTSGARRLHWATVPADIGEFEILQADFCITDGEQLSRPVDQVLAGVTPIISLGDIRMRPLHPVIMRDFFAAKQTWGTLPVPGLTAIRGAARFERSVLLGAMYMGEPDAQELYAFSQDVNLEPLVAQAVKYYAELASTHFIGRLDSSQITIPTTLQGNIPKSEFEIWTQGDVASVRSRWTSLLSANLAGGLVREASRAMYFVRSSGALFNNRVPVELACSRSSDGRRSVAFSTMDGVLFSSYEEVGLAFITGDYSRHLSHNATEIDRLVSAIAPPRKVVEPDAQPLSPTTIAKSLVEGMSGG